MIEVSEGESGTRYVVKLSPRSPDDWDLVFDWLFETVPRLENRDRYWSAIGGAVSFRAFEDAVAFALRWA
jgi:hypothetical protein